MVSIMQLVLPPAMPPLTDFPVAAVAVAVLPFIEVTLSLLMGFMRVFIE